MRCVDCLGCGRRIVGTNIAGRQREPLAAGNPLSSVPPFLSNSPQPTPRALGPREAAPMTSSYPLVVAVLCSVVALLIVYAPLAVVAPVPGVRARWRRLHVVPRRGRQQCHPQPGDPGRQPGCASRRCHRDAVASADALVAQTVRHSGISARVTAHGPAGTGVRTQRQRVRARACRRGRHVHARADRRGRTDDVLPRCLEFWSAQRQWCR